MKHMIIQTQKTVYKVNVDDIYYIQTHPTKAHTVQIVTEEASFNMLQNLSNLENQYGETLMRCHRNCLVNLDKLKSIDFQERILFSEKKVNTLSSMPDVAIEKFVKMVKTRRVKR